MGKWVLPGGVMWWYFCSLGPHLHVLSLSSHYRHSELCQVAPRKARYLRTHFDRFQALIIICGSCDKCIRVVQV